MNVSKEIYEALNLFGVWQAFIAANQQATGLEDLLNRVKEVKAQAMAVYKQSAKKHHPDKGGSLDAMKRLNAAKSVLEQMRLHRPPPPPQMVGITFCFGSVDTFNVSTSVTDEGTTIIFGRGFGGTNGTGGF